MNYQPHILLQRSLSLPCNLLAAPFDVVNVEDAEETTFCLVASSCADITLYASTEALTEKYFFERVSRRLSISPFKSSVHKTSLASPHLTLKTRSFHHDSTDDYFSTPSIPFMPSMQSFAVPNASRIRNRSINTSEDVVILGQFVDSYDVLGTIGEGSYGRVVLARSRDIDSKFYAVKVICRGRDDHQLAMELTTLRLICDASEGTIGVNFLQQMGEIFEDESKIFVVLEYHPSNLSHPEIASRFKLFGDSRHEIPASMSLPLTFTASSVHKANDSEKIECTRFLIAEIVLGLEFLHERGIVHQDIKPANIMISCKGHAIIGDFGAASKMPYNHARYGPIILNPDDLVTFTPLYAAPELRERNQEGLVIYDERSDWWSLGVLLYELCTGTAPFNSISNDTWRRVRRSAGDRSLTFGELEILSSRFKGGTYSCYLGLEDFIRSLLRQNPADRLTSTDIKEHSLLSPLRKVWSDIAGLRYPPCPCPSTSDIDYDNSGLPFKVEVNDVVGLDALGTAPPPSSREISSVGFQSGVFLNDIVQQYFSRTTSVSHPCAESTRDVSDISSCPPALPSSASFWLAAEHSDELFDSGVWDAEQADGFSMSYHTMAPADTSPPKLSFSSVPIFLPSSWYSDTELHLPPLTRMVKNLTLCEDLALAEKITLSMLQAMDNRDREASGERQCHRIRMKPRSKIQKSTTSFLERAWIKLVPGCLDSSYFI